MLVSPGGYTKSFTMCLYSNTFLSYTFCQHPQINIIPFWKNKWSFSSKTAIQDISYCLVSCWECWLHLRQACSCSPRHFRSVVCGIRDLVPSKCKGMWLRMKQYLKYQFQSMSMSSLFPFYSVTLRSFSGACSFKITLFFFKGQNYAIAVMLLLRLLMGQWCICKGCGWKCSFFCLGRRRNKWYFLGEILHSCPEWKFLKGGIF